MFLNGYYWLNQWQQGGRVATDGGKTKVPNQYTWPQFGEDKKNGRKASPINNKKKNNKKVCVKSRRAISDITLCLSQQVILFTNHWITSKEKKI